MIYPAKCLGGSTRNFASELFRITRGIPISTRTSLWVHLISTFRRLATRLYNSNFSLFSRQPNQYTRSSLLHTTIFRCQLTLRRALNFRTIRRSNRNQTFSTSTLHRFTLDKHIFGTYRIRRRRPAHLKRSRTDRSTIRFNTPTTERLNRLRTGTVLVDWQRGGLVVELG